MALLVDCLVGQFRLLQFVVALILLGLIPFNVLLDYATKPVRDELEIDQLREHLRPPSSEGGECD